MPKVTKDANAYRMASWCLAAIVVRRHTSGWGENIS